MAAMLLWHSFGWADVPVTMTLDQAGGAHVVRPAASPYPRLAAEFEPTRLLMFGVADWQPHHREILIEVAHKTAGHANVMVLCNDTWQIKDTTAWLLESGNDFPHVYFCEIPLDTVWLRDFGPMFAQTATGIQALDFYYEGTRPKDDGLPLVWARRTGIQYVEVPWTLQGGNLISNGQGIGLTTNRIFEDNHITFPSPLPQMNVQFERRKMVVDQFVKFCNLNQLAVLEPLQSESTQHVDMFATFLSAADVLVAQLDRHADPINAAILDRNAARLSKLVVGQQPMRVHRIDIPVREGTSWSAYTNIVISGDLVLMPIFNSDPPNMIQSAVAAYRRLLPNHTVETIDMTSMKQLQGELHCLSLHVPAMAPMPDRIYPFANSVQAYFPEHLAPPAVAPEAESQPEF
ncbi:Peptidylarginine deiminase precursor [Rubripirellula lacrimiformis]|uniref:Peptidylarginine deiminase n=2 Tax=Rubripirellula lacrimiformis TaxID=1930273 RepID=A0A517NAW4_9BACT|nr:Peptidylarginine deiminase precursor [Rubripirellula lacrimiformis]